MRYLMTTKADPNNLPTPDESIFEEMGKFVAEMMKAGIVLATGGLDPAGVRTRSEGGKITFTDGPFTESKEVLVSFALVEVHSLEEVKEISRRFWKLVGDGVGDIQQVFGPED